MTGQTNINRSERLLDVRVRERYFKEEAITPEQVQAHLDSLPDSEANAEWVDVPALYPEDDNMDEEDADGEEAQD